MTPTHHIPEDLLLSYATGSSEEAISLLVAAHITLCPQCRQTCEHLDEVGGTMVASLEPAEVSTDIMDKLVERLDEPLPEPAATASNTDSTYPRPLLSYLGDNAQPRWKTSAPGLYLVRLPFALEKQPVHLAQIRAGYTVPHHTHHGFEATLVLTGGFIDCGEHFERGDVAIRNEKFRHDVVMDSDEDCICLIVSDAPLIPLTFYGRLLQLFTPL